MKPCYVHSGDPDMITGYIQEIDGDTIYLHLMFDGVFEFDIQCGKSAFIFRQQAHLKTGRYVGLLRPHNKFHLCTCKWTKEDIKQAEERGKELAEKLRDVEK